MKKYIFLLMMFLGIGYTLDAQLHTQTPKRIYGTPTPGKVIGIDLHGAPAYLNGNEIAGLSNAGGALPYKTIIAQWVTGDSLSIVYSDIDGITADNNAVSGGILRITGLDLGEYWATGSVFSTSEIIAQSISGSAVHRHEKSGVQGLLINITFYDSGATELARDNIYEYATVYTPVAAAGVLYVAIQLYETP